MGADEIELVLERTIHDDVSENDSWWEKYQDFISLLAYRDIDTSRVAEAAFGRGEYYPPQIYRDASPAIRDALIGLLDDPECKEANNILQALAAQGDETVVQAFWCWEQSPPPWQQRLFVPPSVYAHCGGWTLDPLDGTRVELVYDTCYCVAQVGSDAAKTIAGHGRDDSCKHCGCTLMDVLIICGSWPELAFLGVDGEVRIPVCPNCAGMCERTVVKYQFDGSSVMEIVAPFADKNYCDARSFSSMTTKVFGLSDGSVPQYFATGCDDVITIGGMADWIQDAVFDKCPDCGKTMKLLAAIPWDALGDFCEGTLYADICADCQVISLFHQQT
jgi:hypothetical protein